MSKINELFPAAVTGVWDEMLLNMYAELIIHNNDGK